MKLDLIEKKMSELGYKMELEKYAFKKAKYNLEYADVLGLNDEQTRKFSNCLDDSSKKYVEDKTTYDALQEYVANKYAEDMQKILAMDDGIDSKLWFKCTFPKETSDWNTQFQSSIIVNEDVARMFANGVDYRAITECIDGEDIKGISTELNQEGFTDNKNGNVDVELAVGLDTINTCDTPIVARENDSRWKTIIAASKVPYCLPVDDVLLSDIDGNDYEVAVPSFDEIESLKRETDEKVSDMERLMSLDAIVKEKVNTTIYRMNLVLDDVEKYAK